MGLRCLLGHDFGEPELQREREEDGNEVVTTVTEVKTCARCGETQIVSENTEVTTMEQLTDEATAAGAEGVGSGNAVDRHGDVEGEPAVTGDGPSEPVEGPADATADGVGATAGSGAGGDTDDAVIIDDEPGAATTEASDFDAVDGESSVGGGSASEGSETGDGAELLDEGAPGASTDSGLGGDYEEYPDPESDAARTEDREDAESDAARNAETDDGVILDETTESDSGRERGAWPEVEGDESPNTEPTPWPEQEGEDEGYGAEVGEGARSGDVEFGGGLTPETADGAAVGEDAEYVEAPESDAAADADVGGDETDGDADVGVGITRGESPDVAPSTADVTMEYYCPECEMTRDADGNSMRAGDICPECKRGYVTERPTES